ncbi:MAG: EamA family transporter [Pseudomonadota bacterium]|nr:EamA family transporter [Pseudomonadota bacterium]
MRLKDRWIAAAVVLAWGINFVFMKVALAQVQPVVLGLLRFVLLLFPAIFFFKRPAVPWRWLALYGLCISFAQFSLLFMAIAQGMPTGLAALLQQAQAFFTVLLAALLLHEPVRRHHALALGLAMVALGLIGVGQWQGVMPLGALGLMLGAAAMWAAGNLIVKRLGPVDALALVVWGNVSALLAFALAALALYGVQGVAQQVAGMDWRGWGSALYLAYGAGLLGYAGWGLLLSRYPAGQITPLGLLVPVVALLVAFVGLHEPLNTWHWAGVALMLLALAVQVLGGRRH